MILIQGICDGMRPEPRLTVSEWADQHRYLPPTATAMAGPYQTSVTPYLAEIMYHLSTLSSVREVVFMKAAQIGGSELGNNWIGYVIHISPGSMLMIQPTIETAERYSKMRIQPMIDHSAELSRRVKPARSRDSGNTILEKQFPGGIWIAGGANSAASLRSMPIKYLMLDEIDSYPLDLDEEGNPIELAEARQRTYKHSKKTFKLSTPTTEEKSAIAKEFELTDQRYYHVPCPECAGLQHLRFEQLRYKYNPKTKVASEVYYECEHCNHLIAEHHKTKMLRDGKWIATVPENSNPKKVGYHLNSLYSPLGWFGWDDACQKYEAALLDKTKMKTFENTVLGVTSKESGDVPEWQMIYGKREVYSIGQVPAGVAFLTAGVDVQKDRIELEIVGWCPGKRSYSIDYRVLAGTTSGQDSKVWKDLSAVLNETFVREDGAELSISMMCVDSGYNSSEVYAFCRKHSTSRVIPTKGRDAQQIIIANPKATSVSKSNKAIGKAKVWHIGVSMLKTELYGWLNMHKNEDGTYPEGYCHFPQYDEQYFQGLASERTVLIKNKKGYTEYQWKKFFERNEPLDCRIYARAAAAFKGMDTWTPERWIETANEQTGSKAIATTPKAKPGVTSPAKQSPTKKKSSFWNK